MFKLYNNNILHFFIRTGKHKIISFGLAYSRLIPNNIFNPSNMAINKSIILSQMRDNIFYQLKIARSNNPKLIADFQVHTLCNPEINGVAQNYCITLSRKLPFNYHDMYNIYAQDYDNNLKKPAIYNQNGRNFLIEATSSSEFNHGLNEYNFNFEFNNNRLGLTPKNLNKSIQKNPDGIINGYYYDFKYRENLLDLPGEIVTGNALKGINFNKKEWDNFLEYIISSGFNNIKYCLEKGFISKSDSNSIRLYLELLLSKKNETSSKIIFNSLLFDNYIRSLYVYEMNSHLLSYYQNLELLPIPSEIKKLFSRGIIMLNLADTPKGMELYKKSSQYLKDSGFFENNEDERLALANNLQFNLKIKTIEDKKGNISNEQLIDLCDTFNIS